MTLTIRTTSIENGKSETKVPMRNIGIDETKATSVTYQGQRKETAVRCCPPKANMVCKTITTSSLESRRTTVDQGDFNPCEDICCMLYFIFERCWNFFEEIEKRGIRSLSGLQVVTLLL